MANERMARMFGKKRTDGAASEEPAAAVTTRVLEPRAPRENRAAPPATPLPAHRGSGIMTPGVTRRSGPLPAPAASLAPVTPEGRKLVVGGEISLSGEIKACETLVVEGRVEADLADCRHLEITGPGLFRGSASVTDCVIAGTFEGDLTVHGRLQLRATGLVRGSLRYGAMEAELGGRLVGSIDVLDDAPAPAKRRSAAPDQEAAPPEPSPEPEPQEEPAPVAAEAVPDPAGDTAALQGEIFEGDDAPPEPIPAMTQPRGIRDLVERDSRAAEELAERAP